MEFREAVTAVMKYIETTPLQIKGKSVKVCVPGKKKSQVNWVLDHTCFIAFGWFDFLK